MKKTAAIISAIAVLAVSGISASAQQGDNIVEDVISGAEDIVGGVVSGAEDVVSGVTDGVEEIVPGGSDGPADSSTDSSDTESTSSETSVMPDAEDNVPTGVSAMEFAALGAAALGGLGAMAFSLRKKD